MWLGAFSSRYKLIVSPRDPPWLLDREKDPDELCNVCAEPAYRDAVRSLAQALLAYGERCHDPRTEHPKLKADLIRCAEGRG